MAELYSAICFGLDRIICDPPASYAPVSVTQRKNTSAVNSAGNDLPASRMVRTKKFRLITLAMMFGTMACFLINPMMKSLGMARGLSESAAIAAVMICSVLNVTGRLAAPWISDRMKRKTMLILLFGISIASVPVLTFASGFLFILCFSPVCFAYGGFFGIFPVITSDFFGTKYAGMNYGVVIIGCGVISLLCPNIVAMGVSTAFITAAAGCCIGIVCSILIRRK